MEQELLNKFFMYYRLVLFAFIGCFLSCCQGKFFEKNLAQILGVKNVQIVESQSLNEWSGIQGDGYILETYKLSESTMEAFVNRKIKNIKDQEQDGKKWKKYGWNKMPIDSSYLEIFIVGLNYSSNNEKLKKQLIEIKKILKDHEIYYAFYFYPDKENPNCVQLFILDIEDRVLYTIDQQL